MAFSENGIFAENSEYYLRAILPSDRTDYINIFKGKPEWEDLLSNPELNTEERLWNTFNNPETLNLIIIRKQDGVFCGFCGLQQYAISETPELSIEVVECYQNQGVGTAALRLLIQKFAAISDIRALISKVSCGNIASQRLMRKLGGRADGVTLFPGISEEVAQMMEEREYPLPENAEALAEEFGTTPRQLKSHVLVFRFSI
ncbi:MAG: GNAT family N-acetyltransferase [Parabacteroides sp.]|nr:GNAT family N-acetyltransferase [Parabacteroides sp.]